MDDDQPQEGNDLVNAQVRGRMSEKDSISVTRSLKLELKKRALEREQVVRHRVTMADVIRELLGLPIKDDE